MLFIILYTTLFFSTDFFWGTVEVGRMQSCMVYLGSERVKQKSTSWPSWLHIFTQMTQLLKNLLERLGHGKKDHHSSERETSNLIWGIMLTKMYWSSLMKMKKRVWNGEDSCQAQNSVGKVSQTDKVDYTFSTALFGCRSGDSFTLHFDPNCDDTSSPRTLCKTCWKSLLNVAGSSLSGCQLLMLGSPNSIEHLLKHQCECTLGFE